MKICAGDQHIIIPTAATRAINLALADAAASAVAEGMAPLRPVPEAQGCEMTGGVPRAKPSRLVLLVSPIEFPLLHRWITENRGQWQFLTRAMLEKCLCDGTLPAKISATRPRRKAARAIPAPQAAASQIAAEPPTSEPPAKRTHSIDEMRAVALAALEMSERNF